MTSVAPAQRAAPQMTHTADPTATPQAQVAAPSAEAMPARPRLQDQIANNPLLTLFLGLTLAVLTFLGTLAVALLLFVLNDINDGFDSLGERIDSVEVKVDAGFAAQGAQIAELDRKLTALIAHLNATEAVDAALEHRLLIPGASARGAAGEPPG